jgi:RNA polymerase sigma-70 factor (ECF subfamily)
MKTKEYFDINYLIVKHGHKLRRNIDIVLKGSYYVDDVYHNAVIKIITNFKHGKYKEEGYFLAWAHRICYNCCMDFFKNIKKDETYSRDFDESIDIADELNEFKVFDEDRYELLRSKINDLPKNQKKVILLRHYEGYSYKQIAKRLRCKLNSALGWNRVGMISLKKTLFQYNLK